MGTSVSGAQLAGKMQRLAAVVQRSQKAGVTEAAFEAKIVFEKHAGRAGLSPGDRLAGSKWRGVVFNVKGARNPVALVRAARPAWLHNNPTVRRFIGAKGLGSRGRLRRQSRRVGAVAAFGGSNRGAFSAALHVRKGKRALVIPGVSSPRAYAFHPGTRGKGWWQKAMRTVPEKATEAYGDGLRREMRKVF